MKSLLRIWLKEEQKETTLYKLRPSWMSVYKEKLGFWFVRLWSVYGLDMPVNQMVLVTSHNALG
jgi:hypothetical protein